MLEARTPDADRQAIRVIGSQIDLAVKTGFTQCLAIDDQDVGQHMIVNIAAERYNAFMFESDLRLQVALVQGQHEIIRLRERVNVMSDDIAVRKIDAGSGLHHEQVWHETCVNLVHYRAVCR